MSRMSAILFLRYWQKQCSNSLRFHIVFSIVKSFYNSVTRYPIVTGFASKWSILKFWESGVKKLKLKFSTSDSFPLIMSHIISVSQVLYWNEGFNQRSQCTFATHWQVRCLALQVILWNFPLVTNIPFIFCLQTTLDRVIW